MKKFPANFLWGASSSAYQSEGNNVYSDWWQWEKKIDPVTNGFASGHYERYESDFDLLKSLNHNAHRLSIEWARIEPHEGQFDQNAIEHYVGAVKALKARGIEPMVTLHHFTNPQWLIEKGSWENKHVIKYFERYASVVAGALGEHVQFWFTINEPNVFFTCSYLFKEWPPYKSSLWSMFQVRKHLIQGHVKAYHAIKKVYQDRCFKNPQISVAYNMQDHLPCKNTLSDKVSAYLRYRWLNFDFLRKIRNKGALDFIGINYFTRLMVDTDKPCWFQMLCDDCQHHHYPLMRNMLGWDIFPEGIYNVLRRLKSWGLPVYITGNGLCTDNEEERFDFIKDHLSFIHRALEEGVDVKGYLYWSLFDSFEWDKGYKPHFGLITVDPNTQERKVKTSALKYAHICQTGELVSQ